MIVDTNIIVIIIFTILCVMFIVLGWYKYIINDSFFYTVSYGTTIGVMDVLDNSFHLMKTLMFRSNYRYYINSNDSPYDIIRKVNNGDLMIGCVPLNVLYFAYNGIPINKQSIYTNLEFIASLYDYPINLITMDDVMIIDFDDMKEKISDDYGVTIGLLNRYDHYYLLLDIFNCYKLNHTTMNITLKQYDNSNDLYNSYGTECNMIFYPCSHPNILMSKLFNKIYSHFVSFNNIQCAKNEIDQNELDPLDYIEDKSGINPIIKYGNTHIHETTVNLKKMQVFYDKLTITNNQFFIRMFGTRMILIANPDIKERYVKDIVVRLIDNIDSINDEPYVKYMTPTDLSVNPFPNQILTNKYAENIYIEKNIYKLTDQLQTTH